MYKKSIFRKIMVIFIVLCLTLGTGISGKVDLMTVEASSTGGWTWLYTKDGTLGASQIESAQSRAQKFNAAEFDTLRVYCPSYGNNIGNLTLKLYIWNTDYATTVAGTAIASRTFTDFPDNSWLTINFSKRSSGDYLWVLDGASEMVGVWTYTASTHNATSYLNGSTSGLSGFDYVAEVYCLATAPNTAESPIGPTTGTTGVMYEFKSGASTSSGNFLKYLFDWGDGTQSFSGYTHQKSVTGDDWMKEARGRSSHIWYQPGTYQVKVRAYDIFGAPASAWSSALTVTINGSSITPATLTPVSVTASSEQSSSWSASKATDGSNSTSWSSSYSSINPFSVQWLRLDLGSVKSIKRIKVTPRTNGEGFPVCLKLQYSNDNSAWFDLPVHNHFYRPNPGSSPQFFETGGIAARYLRLWSDWVGKDNGNNYAMQIAEVNVYGDSNLLFFSSAGGQHDADWTNMYMIYGIAHNEINDEGSRWRNGPGGIMSLPVTEWQYWGTQQLMWLSEPSYLKDELKNYIYDIPISQNGYIWAYSKGEKHLNMSRHYSYNPLYVLAAHNYYMWTRENSFLTNNLPPLSNGTSYPSGIVTMLDKLRKAIDYSLTTLGGKNGVMIISDPENDGTPTSNASSYWDNYPDGYKSAYCNILLYGATEAMAQIEEALGNTANANTYRSYLPTMREAFNNTFWDSSKGRYIQTIDKNGIIRDYGATFLNMMAVEYGLADADKANLIYSWLDGSRTISGDTSTGSDIYNKWKWAARANTKAIESITPYWWYSAEGQINVGEGQNSYYGGHIENGGAIFYYSFNDILGRIRGIGSESAYYRMQTIINEFRVDELRRDPPNDKGMSWMVGVTGEFPESGLVSLVMPYGFLGVSPKPDGLHIAPKIPSALTYAGMNDIMYRGSKYRITGSKSITTATISNQGTYYDVQVPNGQEVIVSNGSIISVSKVLPRTWALASSEFNFSLNARRMIDNDNSTFYSSAMQTSQNTAVAAITDMGATYKVKKIKLMPRSNGYGFPVDFKFQSSTDGTNWTDISGLSYTNYPNPGSNEQTFTMGTAVNARYIRIYASKIGLDNYNNPYLQLAEFRLETE